MNVSTRRLRLVVVGVALMLLLVTQLFAVTSTGVSARNTALSVAREAIRRESNTTVEAITRHLEPAEQSANVTARLVADSLVDLGEPGLERYLFTQLAVMPQMTGAFVGFTDGSFVFVAREPTGYRSKRITVAGERTVSVTHYDQQFAAVDNETVPDDAYDPRTRPWYALASDADSLQWTEPYVFFSSGQPGVTAARAARSDSGELRAVVGVDVELTGLDSFIDDISLSANGEAFVASGSSVVAAPTHYAASAVENDDGTLRLMTTDELGVASLSTQPLDAVQVIGGDERRDLVLHRAFPAESGLKWTVVVRAPESDFTAAIRQQQRSLLLIWVGGAALIGLSAMVLLRVTRPLQALQAMAATDPLSGVANRRTLNDLGARLLAQARRDGAAISVLVIDLDGFKLVNDTLGHAMGDAAIRMVGEELRTLVREHDVVGRLGGDEFVVVQRVGDRADAIANAERIVNGLSAALRTLIPSVAELGASGGLTVCAEPHSDFDSLLRLADSALIGQKNAERGAVRMAEPMPIG